MSATECWLPIPWSQGRYEVSDLGRVRSTPLVRHSTGLPLKAKEDPGGYPCLEIRPRPREVHHVRVHRLVLEAFVGPRPEGHVARHLNGNPGDNRLANLCWGTELENADDKRRHGTHNNTRKAHCKRGHEFTEENTFRDRKGRRECRACRKAYFAARDEHRRAVA